MMIRHSEYDCPLHNIVILECISHIIPLESLRCMSLSTQFYVGLKILLAEIVVEQFFKFARCYMIEILEV